MTKTYKLDGILSSGKWISPAFIKIDQDGKIEKISDSKLGESPYESISGYAIPSFKNAHSHSFQFAMAGFAEFLSPEKSRDNFWSWRELMYSLALNIDPEQFETIATMLYSRMIANGYSEVAEFHYLHHDKDGRKYNNVAELSERLISAATTAGIKITILPVFYQLGGFGKDPEPEQRRFLSQTTQEYLELLEKVSEYENGDTVLSGACIHSLRAVSAENIIRFCSNFKKDKVIHFHVAEQEQELKDCISFYGLRPVEWMCKNLDLDNRYHLVHATHINEEEIKSITNSRAGVVLCPSTEANLGDGIFPLINFLKEGGKFSIGSDSQIMLNPFEELRLLDYGLRLTTHKRNPLCLKPGQRSAEILFSQADSQGFSACGRSAKSELAEKQDFDALILNKDHPSLLGRKAQQILSSAVYSGDSSMIAASFVKGRKLAEFGKHKNEAKLISKFKKTIESLTKNTY